MSYEEREAIVSAVQETYALTGRALATDVPGTLLERAVRPNIMQQLMAVQIDPLVSDRQMLELLRTAYFDLIDTVIQIQEELLGSSGEAYDGPLSSVHLTGSGGRVKIAGFRGALSRVFGGPLQAMKKAFEWGNIILGSLGAVPVVGVLADPIRELKESVEAQGDDDQSR